VNRRVVIVGLGIVALAAGCASGSSKGKTSAPATTPPATASASPSDSGASSLAPSTSAGPSKTPTSSASPSPTKSSVASRCTSDDIHLSLGQGSGAAGSTYVPIVFTNVSGASCTLHGYPGVSYVNAAGMIIGRPTTEDPGRRATVVIAVHGQASALLRQPEAGNYPPAKCRLTTADRLQVYPPGETHPLFVHDAQQVCASGIGRGGVEPVIAGNGSD
jgi:hypothetical protein